MRERVYIALGGNIGDVVKNFCRAAELIAQRCTIAKASSLYETEPWGLRDQPNFINAVIEIETALSPEDLLYFLQEIEDELGRQRQIRWGRRTIDLDIILFGSRMIDTVELKIPHRYLLYRDFFLVPLLEIEPDAEYPADGRKLAYFLERLPQQLRTIIGKKEDSLWKDTITSLLRAQ